jgi:hypothetical protein
MQFNTKKNAARTSTLQYKNTKAIKFNIINAYKLANANANGNSAFHFACSRVSRKGVESS